MFMLDVPQPILTSTPSSTLQRVTDLQKRVSTNEFNPPSVSSSLVRRRVNTGSSSSTRGPFRQSADLEPDKKHRLSLLQQALETKHYEQYIRPASSSEGHSSSRSSPQFGINDRRSMSASRPTSSLGRTEQRTQIRRRGTAPVVQQAPHLPPVRGFTPPRGHQTEQLPSSCQIPPPRRSRRRGLSRTLRRLLCIDGDTCQRTEIGIRKFGSNMTERFRRTNH